MREFKSERAWGEFVDGELRALPKSWWMTPQTKAIRGIPDRIGCVNGYFVAIELKKPKAKKDPSRESLQKHNLLLMREAGAYVTFERLEPANWDECKAKLDYLVARSLPIKRF